MGCLQPSRAVGLGAWYSDWTYNVRGVLSPDQKATLIQQEAADLLKASVGSLNPSDAKRQATADVTNVLIARNADPSQDTLVNALGLPAFPGGTVGLLLAGGGALLLVFLLSGRR